MNEELPLPAYLPEGPVSGQSLLESVLSLYRELMAARREADEAAREAAARIRTHTLATSATIAALAAEYFEYTRVRKRVQADLDGPGAERVSKVLDLFERSWAAVLAREGLEVRDLTGLAFTDELAEVIDVNSASVNPAATEPIIRTTLVPLVLHHGSVVGKAVVDKAVPPLSQDLERLE